MNPPLHRLRLGFKSPGLARTSQRLKVELRVPMRLAEDNKTLSGNREHLYRSSLNDFYRYLKIAVSNTQSKITRNAADKTT